MRKTSGVIFITLRNGRAVSAHWEKNCRDVHVTCYDDEFFGNWSTDSSDYSAEKDAEWCLKQLILSQGGELA